MQLLYFRYFLYVCCFTNLYLSYDWYPSTSRHHPMPRTQIYYVPLVGVVTLLLMHHTMTWAFIRRVPTRTASFTKTQRMSSAITVIPASKDRLLVLSFFCSCKVIMQLMASLLQYSQGWSRTIHENWMESGCYLQRDSLCRLGKSFLQLRCQKMTILIPVSCWRIMATYMIWHLFFLTSTNSRHLLILISVSR